jgi:hypothetical protein
VILNGFKSAFLPYPERISLIKQTLKELGEIEAELKTQMAD